MKKAFTLVELLAVIIILSALTAIVVPLVISVIDDTVDASYEQLVNNIEQTAQLYARNNKKYIDELNVVDETVTITLQDLVDNEGLKTPVIDPRNNMEVSLMTEVVILVEMRGKFTINVGTFVYE